MAAFILESLVLRGSAVRTDALVADVLRRGTSVKARLLPQTPPPGTDNTSMCRRHPWMSPSPSAINICYRPYAAQAEGGNDPDGVVNTRSGAPAAPGAGRSRSLLTQKKQLGLFEKATRTTTSKSSSSSSGGSKAVTTAVDRLWWWRRRREEGGLAVAAAATEKTAIASPFAFLVAPVGEVLSSSCSCCYCSSGRHLELAVSTRSLEGC